MTIKSVVKTFLTLIIALCVCLLAGYIGGYPALSRMPFGVIIDLHIESYLGGYPGLLAGGTPPMPAWYDALIKPVFSPPSWVFSPVWVVSFVFMGLILFFILQSGIKRRDVTSGLILFGLQLLFTLAWAFAFFGIHAIFPAFICIIALWATLLCAVIQVFRFSVYGGMLLVPYFLWVCYLAYLNYGIMVLNHFVFVI
ncbi:MAG: TspO/MBR family protein [Methanoregula sp.]|jgi:translocator protein